LGLGPAAAVHPRGEELTKMLGSPPYHRYTSEHPGWRAGVRVGMWADD
jgi:hypothetical protein